MGPRSFRRVYAVAATLIATVAAQTLAQTRAAPPTQSQSARADLPQAVDTAPLPRTGLDFSGVDAFWPVADILAADKEPSEAQWRSMLSTPGYRLSLRMVRTTRSDLEIALRPSRRPTFDSLASLTGSNDLRDRVQHLARVYANRAALQKYRDSVAKDLPVEHATALAAKFLPPHATEGTMTPLVAFAFFRDDAYSLGPEAIIVDLEHVRASSDLTMLLAHEFHHSFVAGMNALTFPSGADASTALVRALSSARNEGIADLIDKPYPVQRRGPLGERYSKMYNEAYARTPDVIRSIDSALTTAADDSTKLLDAGSRISQLLPSNGHFNGSYIAREIYETFGVDSLYPGTRNAFAFWRAYGEAEVKRGKPWPFSSKSTALLDKLEKQHLSRTSSATPFEF